MSSSKAPRRRTGGLLLEFAMIILGALLALALDDWRDQQERDERDRAVLVQLAAELVANEQRLERESQYHRDMVMPLQASHDRMLNEGEFRMPEGWQGFRPIILTRTAFDVAVMNGVLARVPPDTALVLARVYEVSERSEKRRNNVSLATIQTSFQDGVRYIRLQQEANIAEVQTADTLLPLIADARGRLDAVKQP